MEPIYDFRSDTLFVAYTEAEYRKAIGDWKLGPNIYADAGGSTDFKVKYRHEHAHFASYMASGLVDLHTFFKNQRLAIGFALVEHFARRSDDVLEVPLVVSEDQSEIARHARLVIEQFRAQEAFFLGYGTNKTPRQLFNLDYIESFYRLIAPNDDPVSWTNVVLNSLHYRRFLRQLYYTTDVYRLDNPDALTPMVSFDQAETKSPVTSRAVMEAYALTIEVIAEFVKAVWTSADIGRTHPKRLPGVLDQPALLMAIDCLSPEPVSLEDYVSGAHVFKSGSGLYQSIALVTFASMQVPVLEELDAEGVVLGSVKQLCPALRFMHIMDNIAKGAIPHPRGVLDEGREEILKWIDLAHKSLGDPWSLKMCSHLFEEWKVDPQKYHLENQVWDLTLAGHAGRVNFFAEPREMIEDAGIWLNYPPCWVRYIGTADGKIISWINPDESDAVRLFRLMDISGQVIEALIFSDVWFSTWEKVAYYEDIDRDALIGLALKKLYKSPRDFRISVRPGYDGT